MLLVLGGGVRACLVIPLRHPNPPSKHPLSFGG